MTLQTSKLSNGLRILTDTVDTVESVAIGIWANVGTRHEDMQNNGVAHMVEHMLFNGTEQRTAQDIVKQIENVGGQMNAYTSRENTAYYVHALKEDAPLALEVLSDMIQNSTFPDSEIEKERGVITQEINMTLDTPDDLVFDMYQETAYPNQTLGAPILGTESHVQGMQRDVLMGHVDTHYTANNLVISASGNIAHDDLVKMAESYLSDISNKATKDCAVASYQGGANINTKDLEQAHVVLGFQGIAKNHDDYHATILLATMMGGGMSSRLFQEIREKRGLAYSVYASHSAYKDDGQFEIYAGTNADKLDKLLPVICDEIDKIRDNDFLENELNRAKSQLKSGILMGRESMLSRANRQAKFMLNFDRKFDLHDLINKIDAVSLFDIQKIAQKIFSSTPTLAALGPVDNLTPYDEIKTKLAA